MDTDGLMDLILCKRALDKYSAIVAAIDQGRGGYAKEKLKELELFLGNQTQHSAFRGANSRLPRATTNLSEWKSELAYSRSYIEEYIHKLQRKS